MAEAHYGYGNVGLLCGHCGNVMDGSVSDHQSKSSEQPFKYRVVCRNRNCPYDGIVYDVGDEAKITLTKAT